MNDKWYHCPENNGDRLNWFKGILVHKKARKGGNAAWQSGVEDKTWTPVVVVDKYNFSSTHYLPSSWNFLTSLYIDLNTNSNVSSLNCNNKSLYKEPPSAMINGTNQKSVHFAQHT